MSKKSSFWFARIWNSHWYVLSMAAILVISAVLRLYQLGSIPHGMTWDEAAIAYNGYSVIHYRRDEWLHRLPFSFKSFGDYKAPLAIYLNGLSTAIFGLNLWAVRLPFAIGGILAIAGMMVLVEELAKRQFSLQDSQRLAIVSGFLMMTLPWHLHFSRVGFESGLALLWLIWGVWAVVRWVNGEQHTDHTQRYWWHQFLLIKAAILFAWAMYSYHSSKIAVPLLVAVLGISFWPQLKKHWQQTVVAVGVGFLGLLPMLYDTFMGKGAERLNQVSIIKPGQPLIDSLSLIVSNFLSHFSPNFLSFGVTTTLRHGDGQWGVLFSTVLFLVIAAIISGFWHVRQMAGKGKRANLFPLFLGIVWIVVGTLPAALGEDVPHANRAFLALPGYIILATWGASWLWQYLSQLKLNAHLSGSKGESNLLPKAVFGCLWLVHVLFALAYIRTYFTRFASASAADFQDGYIEAMQYAYEHENEVDKIFVTGAYGQPYIYGLYVRQASPIWFHNGGFIKYEFADKLTEGHLLRPNALLLATPKEISPSKADKLVLGSDGSVRFVIVKTPAAQ